MCNGRSAVQPYTGTLADLCMHSQQSRALQVQALLQEAWYHVPGLDTAQHVTLAEF